MALVAIAAWHRRCNPLYGPSHSLEMVALTRLPTRTFGTLMSMEPALAAFSGMIFLGETLNGTQLLALCSIIIASIGSTLTIKREPTVKSVDIN